MRTATTTTLIACLASWTAAAFAAQSQQTAPSQQPQPVPTSQPAVAPQPQPALVSQPTAQQSPPALPSETLTAQPSSPATYSADGLYNLANQYARAGKAGLAVLNYERAALLAPNDPDITSNLEYVRATAQISTEPRTRFIRFAQSTNPTTAAWLGVIGLALLGGSLLANEATRRYRGLKVTAAVLGIGFIGLTISSAVALWPRLHDAVILINQTPARVSPAAMGDTAFVLREAETVTMAAEHENFILIRTRTGRTGWVARASVAAVVP
jgi:tetratricopeptide (TPR) repeat protein